MSKQAAQFILQKKTGMSFQKPVCGKTEDFGTYQ
jgi:hypothetical protein